jgi:hypothetical protein
MYISILNWQFSPYFSPKWLNFHIRFVMPNVSVTNRVFKDIYYLFPHWSALDEKFPCRPRAGEIFVSILYLYAPPNVGLCSQKFSPFVKYFARKRNAPRGIFVKSGFTLNLASRSRRPRRLNPPTQLRR